MLFGSTVFAVSEFLYWLIHAFPCSLSVPGTLLFSQISFGLERIETDPDWTMLMRGFDGKTGTGLFYYMLSKNAGCAANSVDVRSGSTLFAQACQIEYSG